MKVSGTFEVKLTPSQFFVEGVDGVQLGHVTLDKTFFGELDATSQGEMLSAMTSVKGSAGYVAIEQVIGKLAGRKGSFVLQHFGTMHQGGERLILEVVPGSGAGELKGLQGNMHIRIESGQHFYDFDFDFDAFQN